MAGYAAIGLVNPKSNVNVGSAIRAAHVFGAAFVATSGRRYTHAPTDPAKGFRSIPVLHRLTDVFDCIPYDCIPIAVDLTPDAIPLETFVHPKRAIYIFGAEDATLGKTITSRCKHTLFIKGNYCLNLAAAVNVVLYDRSMKEQTNASP